MPMITGIEKQKNLLICTTDSGPNRNYTIDFNTGVITGVSGRPIKSIKTVRHNMPAYLCYQRPFGIIITLLADFADGEDFLGVVDSLTSYPELISDNMTDLYGFIRKLRREFNGQLPKGYVKYLRQTEKMFSLESLYTFQREQRLASWPSSLVDIIERITRGAGLDLITLTNFNMERSKILVALFQNSIKRYEIDNLCWHIRAINAMLDTYPTLVSYIDMTKTASTVCNMLTELKDTERNKAILFNEAKISTLHGKIVDDFLIHIPQSMKDFTDEGEQQHNCVGHYYHESMAQGTCLIYFLRKPETPKKSYVTCQFDTGLKKTIQSRIVNNSTFHNPSLFEKIDRMIREELGKDE